MTRVQLLRLYDRLLDRAVKYGSAEFDTVTAHALFAVQTLLDGGA
jgi:hypothetical protein